MKLKLKKKEVKMIQEALRLQVWDNKIPFLDCDLIRIVEKLQKELDKDKEISYNSYSI